MAKSGILKGAKGAKTSKGVISTPAVAVKQAATKRGR